ncbi:MAG: glycosyltransferase family 39 protein [Myxococcota bacterium]
MKWALLTSGAYVVLLWLTAPEIGFTRDEGYYFKAAEQYFGWFEHWGDDAFGQKRIDAVFGYNHEHPPLVKLSQGATHALLSEGLGWTSPSTGFRAAGFLFAGLALLGTFLLGRRFFDSATGLLAACLLASIPRIFFDGHLACFDVPIMALWVWSLWAFARAWRGRRRDVLLAGFVFGLALSAKLNALFLPFVFGAFVLAEQPQDFLPRWRRSLDGALEFSSPVLPWRLVAVGVAGMLVFFALWPWLWPDPVDRVGEYLRFHLKHEHYPASYFGELLVAPPFPMSFPWVMSFFTVPSPVLLLGTVGLLWAGAELVRPEVRGRSALLLMGALLPIVLISLPGTPIFGGTKHWYNGMPVLCVLGARVAVDGFRHLAWPPRWRPAVAATCGLLLLAPGVLGAVRVHPNGIGFYNELAGGVRGGAELGMQRAFWGYVAAPLLDQLEPSSAVFFNRTNYDSYRMYRREGRLPEGTRYRNGPERADAAFHFEQPEHGEVLGQIWSEFGPRPVATVEQDGVTLAELYVKGASDQAPPSTHTSTAARGIEGSTVSTLTGP